jgi:hypothetical protein
MTPTNQAVISRSFGGRVRRPERVRVALRADPHHVTLCGARLARSQRPCGPATRIGCSSRSLKVLLLCEIRHRPHSPGLRRQFWEIVGGVDYITGNQPLSGATQPRQQHEAAAHCSSGSVSRSEIEDQQVRPFGVGGGDSFRSRWQPCRPRNHASPAASPGRFARPGCHLRREFAA